MVKPPREDPEQSRLKGGVAAFGPAGRILMTLLVALPMLLAWWLISSAQGSFYAAYFVLGIAGLWLVAAHRLLPEIWSKERTSADRMPVSGSIRELKAVRDRSRLDRLGQINGRYACWSCHATRLPGEKKCNRCGATGWVEPDGPGGFYVCGACDSRLDEGSLKPWCGNCKAPRSKAIWIQPSGRTPEAATTPPPAASNPYRSFGIGSKVSWTVAVLIPGLVMLAFHGQEATWAVPGYLIVASVALFAIWRA